MMWTKAANAFFGSGAESTTSASSERTFKLRHQGHTGERRTAAKIAQAGARTRGLQHTRGVSAVLRPIELSISPGPLPVVSYTVLAQPPESQTPSELHPAQAGTITTESPH